jgi:hypothetical protein
LRYILGDCFLVSEDFAPTPRSPKVLFNGHAAANSHDVHCATSFVHSFLARRMKLEASAAEVETADASLAPAEGVVLAVATSPSGGRLATDGDASRKLASISAGVPFGSRALMS